MVSLKRVWLAVIIVGALHAMAGEPSWQKLLPRPIYDANPALVSFYEKAWTLAHDRIDELPGLPAPRYMDEAHMSNRIWIWDTCFMVHFCKYCPKEFPGIESLENFYGVMLADANKPLPKVRGNVWCGADEGKMLDFRIHHPDNPPLFAWTEYVYALQTGDKSRLEKVYRTNRWLQRWYALFDSFDPAAPQPYGTVEKVKLKKVPNGYHWGGCPSGMDNTPRGRAGKDDKGNEPGCPDSPDLLWVDALAQQGLSALSLSRIADLLGDAAGAKEWRQRYEKTKSLLNRLYWDEADGFYYDISESTGKKVKVPTAASYWPLLAEAASPAQAKRMLALLTDDRKFGGPMPVPSLSRDDPDFHADGTYWRGSMWMPTAYMAVKAADAYGDYETARTVSRKIVEMMYRTYVEFEPHTIWECYSPTEAKPATNKRREFVRYDFCGWSALGPISLLIEDVIGVKQADAFANTLTCDFEKDPKGRVGVENYSFGKVTCSVVATAERITVESDASFTLKTDGREFSVKPGRNVFNRAGKAVERQTKDYELRDGAANTCYYLQNPKNDWPWMVYANRASAWQKGCGVFDYAEMFRDVMSRLYGRQVRCNKHSCPDDLEWAQYRPGGRYRDGPLVVFDSAILARDAESDPQLACERFEIMIRQSMLEWPWQSRLIVHGDAPELVSAYRNGKTHPAIEIAERIAEHYGMPSLNLARVAATRGTAALPDVVRGFAETVFSVANVPEKPVPAEMPKPINAGINTSCRIVTYDDGAVRRKGSWQVGVKPPVPGWMHVLEARGVGAEMEMEFRGTEVGLVDVSCTEGAVYAFAIDDGPWKVLQPATGEKPIERHTVLATGLSFSGFVSAANDADRHRIRLRVERLGVGCIAGFMLNGSTADETAGGGRPTTLKQMDAVYAGMEPIVWQPPAQRHLCLPKTMRRLREGGELRIVMLGDSLISDTCKPRNDLLLMRLYPKCKVTVVCSSRSGTGCTWYKDENRVEGWVASHRPDLLVIGGVSNGDDAEAVRSVVRQSRQLLPGLEVLLLTPVFGPEGDAKRASWNVGWNYDPDKAQNPFRRELRKVAKEESCAYFDICAEQRKYCLGSGCDMGYFKRDQYHANLRGQQLVARLLEKWFSPE